MRDDELDDLLGRLSRGPAPRLPGAAAARTRGEQRTRRGRAVLAGAGAVVTALVVTAGATLAEPDRDEPPRPEVLEVATARPSPAEDRVRAALLDVADLDVLLAGTWTERADDALPVVPDTCDDGSRLGATPPRQGDTGTAVRTFSGPDGVLLGHAVLSFGDVARATAARERLAAALRSCAPAAALAAPVGAQVVGGARPLLVEQLGPVLVVLRWTEQDDEALLGLGRAAADEARDSGLAVPPGAGSPATPSPTPTARGPRVEEALLDPDDTVAVEPGQWQAQAPRGDERVLPPCAGADGYATDRRVLEQAARTLIVFRETGGTTMTQEVRRYDSAAAAAAAVDGYQSAVRACPRQPGPAEGVVLRREVVRAVQDGGLLVSTRAVCDGCPPDPAYAAVVQEGPDVVVLEVVVGEAGDPGTGLAEAYAAAALAELERARG